MKPSKDQKRFSEPTDRFDRELAQDRFRWKSKEWFLSRVDGVPRARNRVYRYNGSGYDRKGGPLYASANTLADLQAIPWVAQWLKGAGEPRLMLSDRQLVVVSHAGWQCWVLANLESPEMYGLPSYPGGGKVQCPSECKDANGPVHLKLGEPCPVCGNAVRLFLGKQATIEAAKLMRAYVGVSPARIRARDAFDAALAESEKSK